jgi:hypothetical protein
LRTIRYAATLYDICDILKGRAWQVAISGRLEHLYDYTRGEDEATIMFPNPPPLLAAAQVLYAVATVSQGYGLTKVHVLRHFS